MIPQPLQFHKSLRLTVGNDTVLVFFTLQTIEKAKCAVAVLLAKSVVNGLVYEFEELNLFCLAKLLCYQANARPSTGLDV